MDETVNTMPEFVTQAEFARLKGCTKAYITKLKHNGRLVMTDTGLVDTRATEALLQASADPSKEGGRRRSAEQRGQAGQDQQSKEYGDFQAHRAKRERHMAGLAELEEAKQRGQLLDAAQVVKALTDNAAAMRTALERLPDRIAPVLAAETDANRVYEIMEKEIGQLLDELAHIAATLPESMAGTKQ